VEVGWLTAYEGVLLHGSDIPFVISAGFSRVREVAHECTIEFTGKCGHWPDQPGRFKRDASGCISFV
jgi:hypothetical protein